MRRFSYLNILSTLISFTTATTQNLTAYVSGNDLNGLAVNADGEAFWLGLKEPGTYCPLSNQSLCPAGTETIFDDASYLWVEVPGGQETYVTQDGAWEFTQAHSSSVPTNATVGGWEIVTVNNLFGNIVTFWSWPSSSTSVGGTYACPGTGEDTGLYQIFAGTEDFDQTDCVALQGLLPVDQPDSSVYGAWQYV